MAIQGAFGKFCCTFLLVVLLHSVRVTAFGAGNIASISAVEGENWRHGDIEDTLLQLFLARVAGGKRFTKMDVKRVYFGNWLRDYSQAVDVGAVKYVSAEAVRLILWVLGFMSFGYGTGGFEVTRDRLGCYRPEEHIDNPKDYADNQDARHYDPRLRGPVDERRELSIDERTGLKHYIATEDIGIMTSAALVRNTYGRCIELGRRYARTRNEADLFEAFRLLGTADHCLEDYAAHSNYVELCLREMGETEVFPFVGDDTAMRLQGARGPVYPIVTGTFGGVDFLHSVMGEFSDKATQSEIQELQGTVQSSQQGGDFSLLQDLLGKIPSGIFGDDKDQAAKANELQMNAQAAQMQSMNITPRQPEAWARWLDDVSRQIYPVLEWHDEIMLSLTETIEKIPVLPDLIDQLTDQLNIFVFSLLAPFVVPVINQVKNELATGSSEIIQSSRDKQLNVFYEAQCTDPTHSMLSKDHFSNLLNEPAGKVSSAVLTWVVPQIMAAWDDERIDINRTLTRIINGVFHHPAQRMYGDDGAVDGRGLMFSVVERWWSSKDEGERSELRRKLSKQGCEQGWNHKEGVVDSGHGCGKPLGMPTMKTASSSGAIGGLAAGLIGGGVLGEIGDALSGSSRFDSGATSSYQSGGGSSGGKGLGGFATGAAGGVLAGAAGVAAMSAGADLISGVFSEDRRSSHDEYRESDGGYVQQYSQSGYAPGGVGGERVYAETEVRETDYGSSGWEERTETRYQSGGGGEYTEVQEERQYSSGGGYQREEQQQEYYSGGGYGGGGATEYEERTTTTTTTTYESERYGGGEEVREQEYERREQFGGGGGYEQREEVFEERDDRGGGGYEREEVYEERDDRGGGGYEREEVYEERDYGGGGEEEVYEERVYED